MNEHLQVHQKGGKITKVRTDISSCLLERKLKTEVDG